MRTAHERGFTFYVAPDIEFFYFEQPEAGQVPRPLDNGSFFDLTTNDAAGNLRKQTIRKLEQSGFTARAVATRVVDFGPVMTSYAERLEAAGLLEPGRREEELVVIRVDRV